MNGMSNQFFQTHLKNRKYINKVSEEPLIRYRHHCGWIDTEVDSEMIFSHRDTYFTYETFTEGLHTHEYYELLIYMSGNVEYIIENTLIKPAPFTAIWFSPYQMHTARLLSPCQYNRYVLYFSKDFFCLHNKSLPMISFIEQSGASSLNLENGKAEELRAVLEKLNQTVESQKPYTELLLKAQLIELFDLLNFPKNPMPKENTFVDPMAEIKWYIDKEYAGITSISEIANHFFYSREHLSRAFRQSFNISISNYIAKRRIMESLPLLREMSIADATYAVGFRSQSAFIAAFEKNMGCLPSEYKAKHKQ